MGEIDTEHTLYQSFSHLGNRAYSAYKSALREVVSFERALDHRLKRETGLSDSLISL
ncbi:MAG: hypothetical protein HC767_10645 [Akkermansiaceae bacterium]|nr:hypothetical protein [Akkermansiaceae bacterium]